MGVFIKIASLFLYSAHGSLSDRKRDLLTSCYANLQLYNKRL